MSGKSNYPGYRFCRQCGSEASAGDEEEIVPGIKPIPKSTSVSSASKGRGRGVNGGAKSGSRPGSGIFVEEGKDKSKETSSRSSEDKSQVFSTDKADMQEERKRKMMMGGTIGRGRKPSNLSGSKGEIDTKLALSTPNNSSSPTSTGGRGRPAPRPPVQEEGDKKTVTLGRGRNSGVFTPVEEATATGRSPPPSREAPKAPKESQERGSGATEKRASVAYSQDILEGRMADEKTRSFLLKVVKFHEEGIREEALQIEAEKQRRKNNAAPTVKLKSSWSKNPSRKETDGTIAGWVKLGIDSISEQDGGMPLIAFHCTQYFAVKKCHNYPNLLKAQGSPATVNRILEAFAEGSFNSFDNYDVTPLDVASCLRSFLLILPDSVITDAIFYELLDVGFQNMGEKRVTEVRLCLQKLSAPCRMVTRLVLEWMQAVVDANSKCTIQDASSFMGPALARPKDGDWTETDPSSYAIIMLLLELGSQAFEARASVKSTNRMSLKNLSLDGTTAEELTKAKEKIASLQRQLDESRKGQAALRKKLDVQTKENGELRRKNAELQKQIDGFRANTTYDALDKHGLF